jgi:spermidine/putrescine transport system permease protein
VENFNTTLFTRGTYDTLTVYVFSRVRSGITPTINALALILVTITIIGALWYEIARRRRQAHLDASAAQARRNEEAEALPVAVAAQ